MIVPRPKLHCAEPLALWRFWRHLPAKYRRKTKKVLPSERGAPGTVPMVNPPWLLHYVHKKRLRQNG